MKELTNREKLDLAQTTWINCVKAEDEAFTVYNKCKEATEKADAALTTAHERYKGNPD